MKDFAGNELNVGDRVVYLTNGRSSSWFVWGTVAGYTAKKVHIKPDNNPSYDPDGTTLRYPDALLKPLTPPSE